MNPIEAKKLFELHADVLYRIAVLNLCYEADATDVVRDSLCDYLKNNERSEDPSVQRVSLLKILLKKCKNNIRRSKLRSGFCVDRPEAFNENEALFDAIARMPDRYKNPYALYRLEKMKINEVCGAVKITNSSAVLKVIGAGELLKQKSFGEDDELLRQLYLNIKAPEELLMDVVCEDNVVAEPEPNEKKTRRAETRFVRILSVALSVLVVIYAFANFAGGAVNFRVNGKNAVLKPREAYTKEFSYVPCLSSASQTSEELTIENATGISFEIGIYSDAVLSFESGRFAVKNSEGEITEISSGKKINGKTSVYFIDDGSADSFALSVIKNNDENTLLIKRSENITFIFEAQK